MPKGLLFWIVWIICLLGFFGVTFFADARYVIPSSGVIVLVLTGLLGWQTFGPPIQ